MRYVCRFSQLCDIIKYHLGENMREIKFRIWEKKQRVMEFFGPKWSLGDEYYVLGFLFEGE